MASWRGEHLRFDLAAGACFGSEDVGRDLTALWQELVPACVCPAQSDLLNLVPELVSILPERNSYGLDHLAAPGSQRYFMLDTASFLSAAHVLTLRFDYVKVAA
jgi:hypothetical protein